VGGGGEGGREGGEGGREDGSEDGRGREMGQREAQSNRHTDRQRKEEGLSLSERLPASTAIEHSAASAGSSCAGFCGRALKRNGQLQQTATDSSSLGTKVELSNHGKRLPRASRRAGASTGPSRRGLPLTSAASEAVIYRLHGVGECRFGGWLKLSPSPLWAGLLT
jgi:hypothetical protein